MNTDPIMITGAGVVSPLGDNLDAFIENLFQNTSGISNITLFNSESYDCTLAAEISQFNAKQYLGKKGLRNMDRSTQLLLTASTLAAADANYETGTYDDDQIGVAVGNTFGSLKSISEYDRVAILEGASSVSPIDFGNCVINSAAGFASIRLKAMCVNVTISNGITSCIDAMGYAMDYFKNNDARLIFAGAVEELCEETFFGFHKVGLLAKEKETTQLKGPYDHQANGMILGEGSAIFTMEPLAHAKQRGAAIYAGLGGYGRYFDSGEDRVDSMSKCMQKALMDSGCRPTDIDVIISSANGQSKLDRYEIQAIASVFDGYKGSVPVTSIKGATGECYSASGAFQVATALGIFQNNKIPALVNCYACIDNAPNVKLVTENYQKPVKNILINTFNFSGSLASIVLKRAPALIH
jgi:3-oxoacyl-[acyl-carrier-protein] synthase II